MATTAAPAAVVPARTAAAEVEGIATAMGRLARAVEAAGQWSSEDRRGLLASLDRAVDGLTAVRATVLMAERESGAWRDGGDRSFEAWRSRTARTSQRSAVTQVREAEQLSALPTAAAAVTAGRIGLDHAATIAKVASTGTPAQRDAVQSPDAQAELLRLAQTMDAGTFAITVARWAAAVDPAGLERDHQAQRRERYLHLSETTSGTFLKGRLDSVAGHRVKLALEALTPRPAAEDDRDFGQRRADALDAMAGRILASAETKPGAHVPPHVSLILTAETWDAARAERDRRRRAARIEGVSTERTTAAGATTQGVGIRRSPNSPGGVGAATAPATLEDGTPLPATELAVAMCDCAVTRIAIDADGAPLDLGRTARVFTGPQRRAVIARDRECVWPECHMPARWCEVHHTRWWERDGGSTSVEEGALLCTFHHHEVHRRDLTVTRRPPPTGAADTVARVRYEVRDPSGRVIGAPTTGSGREPPDSPRSTWTADPFTGMRMPTFLADP